MYVAIASPPWSGSRAYNPRRLIHVEQGRAEQEHDRDPLQEQRRERNAAGGECDTRIRRSGTERKTARADVSGRPECGAESRDEHPLERARELRDCRPHERRPDAERERRPEARAV